MFDLPSMIVPPSKRQDKYGWLGHQNKSARFSTYGGSPFRGAERNHPNTSHTCFTESPLHVSTAMIAESQLDFNNYPANNTLSYRKNSEVPGTVPNLDFRHLKCALSAFNSSTPKNSQRVCEKP